ncbi:MAG: hypothetical protein QOF78_702 [Phycisphaerales bacterium]|jgi:hypothetical protein|nr:hypothetical protein [Phycisphaerales bacterium]
MSLGVVTAYFNLHGNPERLAAYLRHRDSIERAGVRHLTVEIQLPGQKFTLAELPNVRCLRTDFPKWHKTNCINIGGRELANGGCRYVAWIDADVVMPDTDWPARTVDALKKHDLVQLQSVIIFSEDPARPRLCLVAGGSLVEGKARAVDGGGWAARSEFFEHVGVFDCVVSGANKAVLTPINRAIWPYGDIAYAEALDRYAQRAAPYIRSVTYIPQTISDVNHGNRSRRGKLASKRFEMLAHYGFVFERDCYYDKNGVIRWVDPRKPVARAVGTYMCRREYCL